MQVGFAQTPDDAMTLLIERGEATATLVLPSLSENRQTLTLQAVWHEKKVATDIEIVPSLYYLPLIR